MGPGVARAQHRAVGRAAVAAVLFGLVLVPALAFGAAPANDDLTGAEVLSGPLPIEVGATNEEATVEPGEPDHAGQPGGASIWFEWTAPQDLDVAIESDTCAPDGRFGPDLLAVYTGAGYPLTPVGSEAHGCINRVTLAAQSGEKYSIAIDGVDGLQGPVLIRIRPASPPPANDDLAGAQLLNQPLRFRADGSNVGAGTEPGEPSHAGDPGGASVWYRWTSPASQRVVVESCGSDFDTLLAAYRGSSFSGLVPIAADDDGCGAQQSSIEFHATAGETYLIAVDGFRGDEGAIVLAFSRASPPETDEPREGETLGGAAVSGDVRVRAPGSRSFTPMTEGQTIPVGSVIDARRGKVTLAWSYNGVIERAAFSQGVLRATQQKGPRPYMTAALTGQLQCGGPSARGGQTAARRRKGGRGRRLWGNGKGHVKTRGRRASATVRGTRWLTRDRCDGASVIRVTRGRLVARSRSGKPVRLSAKGRSTFVARR